MQVDGEDPDLRQEIRAPGDAVLHAQRRFAYLPPSNRRSRLACGIAGCWDQFAVTLPCGEVPDAEDSPTLTVRVVQPPPQNISMEVLPNSQAMGGACGATPDCVPCRDHGVVRIVTRQ